MTFPCSTNTTLSPSNIGVTVVGPTGRGNPDALPREDEVAKLDMVALAER